MRSIGSMAQEDIIAGSVLVICIIILYSILPSEPENPPHVHQWTLIEYVLGPPTYYCRECGELRGARP